MVAVDPLNAFSTMANNLTYLSPKGRPQPKQQTFLFVDSSEGSGSDGAKQGRRNARSFVMQNARRQRPWSTSKQPGIRARAARGASCNSSNGSASASRSLPTSNPSRPLSRQSETFQRRLLGCDQPAQLQTDLIHHRPGRCWECHTPCHPGDRLCQNCDASLSARSNPSPTPMVGTKMDPFGSLPTQLDAQGEALTAHCEFCLEMVAVILQLTGRNKTSASR